MLLMDSHRVCLGVALGDAVSRTARKVCAPVLGPVSPALVIVTPGTVYCLSQWICCDGVTDKAILEIL